jgi:hypothetical protein
VSYASVRFCFLYIVRLICNVADLNYSTQLVRQEGAAYLGRKSCILR